MKFSLEEYEATINSLLIKKYDFIDHIRVISFGAKLGTFNGTFIVVMRRNTIKKMDKSCSDKVSVGSKISFWDVAICFYKKFNIIQLEKDLGNLYWDMSGENRKPINVIKTEYIVN